MDDLAIRALVARLSRPHRSGGHVIERSSILAEGTGSADVLAWIADHDGEPEAAAPPRPGQQGLHGSHFHDRGPVQAPVPRRYVLPPGTLD
ncbi:hypothetical protein AB0L40_16005 [Patulibacter sp. NPDC049589]|uniref:hypothetical protein n=1 Tax=Patulibacter sp. NPDC049589 TaxID=3154731 RepID=UPI003429DED9